jgi:2-keto-4-pentenoate hydratase
VIDENRTPVLEGLAERLAIAWKNASVIDGISEVERPRDRPEAYFAQDHMARSLGLPTTGWKIGATTAMMRKLGGHDGLIPGRLFPSTTHIADHHTLALGDCPNPKVETEFGVRLKADLPLRAAPWAAEEITPIISVHPALEIIGNRFRPSDVPQASLSMMAIADNGGCVAGVIGPEFENWQTIDFLNHPVSFSVDGGAASENFIGKDRCDPRQVVADLANLLAVRGLSLSAGDFLLTGAATVPQPVQKGSTLAADYGALGRLTMDFI